MRYLTIERKKSLAACLTTFQVYIEDPQADDLEIGGVQCRKLGTLKNGEKSNFRISESAARVYVIADKLSKEFCSACYQLPAGPESITVSGKCVLSPATGNAFRFDGVDPAVDQKKRKKAILISTIALAVAVIAAVVIIVIASIEPKAEPYTYYIDDMQITLTQDFTEFDAKGYERAYDSEHVALMVLQEEFTLMEGLADYTIIEYGELVLGNNPNTAHNGLQTKEGVLYFEYETVNQQDGENYHYIVTMYKGPDAFWMIQYIVNANEVSRYRDDIFKWASSVQFNQK